MNTFSILLLDDDEHLRQAIEAALIDAGHRVTAARDVTTACSLLHMEHFDIVLTDVLLEEGDSTELIRTARRVQPNAYIIAMSGGGDFLRASFCLDLAVAFGANLRLAKPFSQDELLSAVAATRVAAVAPEECPAG